ncbi:hypothetical protein EDD29_6416 [Actinocorallia herbida]|uniref:Replication initiation protein n=1 Tax=Actinocorallia herbida TaxID=58109 RepID=A0A3N1D5C4_9ACTN|nr:replication initiator [Actinocorallia herbida]ROO88737.1 hypothetical protein EDD29_6416 [Actinocorallia herbida]
MGAAAQMMERRLREDFPAWEGLVERAGWCVRPVRVMGGAAAVHPGTGEVLAAYDSQGEPDGSLLIACGDRRAGVCPPCSARYRANLWRIIVMGLDGSAGAGWPVRVPGSVSAHPAVFATLTAPSWGRVHRVRSQDGACHPSRGRPVCEHGTARWCNLVHADGRQVGDAMCVSCYGYTDHVLWHASMPELWRRTVVGLPRALARQSGPVTGTHRTVKEITALLRPRFARVVEWQRRGALHVHAVVRLDGRSDGDVAAAPPAWAGRDLLAAAVRDAALSASVSMPAPDGVARSAVWGSQLDVSPITNPSAAARYLAKYSTKVAGDTLPGWPMRAFGPLEMDRMRARGVSWHLLMLAGTCLRLARRYPDLSHLAERVHQMGYGGHYASKSPMYSMTMLALSEARRSWRARRSNGDVWADLGAVVVGDWRLVGLGYRTAGDAEVAGQLYRQEQQVRAARRVHDVAVVRLVDGEEEAGW